MNFNMILKQSRTIRIKFKKETELLHGNQYPLFFLIGTCIPILIVVDLNANCRLVKTSTQKCQKYEQKLFIFKRFDLSTDDVKIDGCLSIMSNDQLFEL